MKLVTFSIVAKPLQAIWWVCLVSAALVQLHGCAYAQSQPTGTQTGSSAIPAVRLFVPVDAFSGKGKSTQAASRLELPTESPAVAGPVLGRTTVGRNTLVSLYASPVTKKYLSDGGADPKLSTRVWSSFLRKYKIPFQVLDSVEQLEQSQPGVLLLPSAVALSEREKLAVVGYRAKGGGVLASWLTGVRDENGKWQGFDFMQRALDAIVVGNTEGEKDDTYLMPYGDTPVTHSLPAGLRIWMERASEWYPLRLVGSHPAGQMMDWSRSFLNSKEGTTILFDERRQSTGLSSRSVVLSYPERLWLSSDPKLVDAIAHNSLMWLLHQTDAYVSAWPHPYLSAAVVAVTASEMVGPTDLSLATRAEESGAELTFYLASESIGKSADIVRKLSSRGHELAYFGSHFEGFRDQPLDVQTKRFLDMRKGMKDSGVTLAEDAGFRAPMESYDKNTEKILIEQKFGHHLASMDVTDARLPFIPPGVDAQTEKRLVVLPRTQQGPEEALEEGDPEEGLKNFLDEMDLSRRMGGLSVIVFPNQSLLTPEQLTEIFRYLKTQRDKMWLATAGQVAEWWRERDRVSIQLMPGAVAPELTVNVRGDKPLNGPVAVWINLPELGSSLRIVPKSGNAKATKVASVDAWRAAILLNGLAPGEYRWELMFDGQLPPVSK